jgi:hypothetical protein
MELQPANNAEYAIIVMMKKKEAKENVSRAQRAIESLYDRESRDADEILAKERAARKASRAEKKITKTRGQ